MSSSKAPAFVEQEAAANALAGIANTRPDLRDTLVQAGCVERAVRCVRMSTPSVIGESRPAPLSDAHERLRAGSARLLLSLLANVPAAVLVRFDLPGSREVRSGEGWNALLAISSAGSLEGRGATVQHHDTLQLADTASVALRLFVSISEGARSFLRYLRVRDAARLAKAGATRLVKLHAAAALGLLLQASEGQDQSLIEGLQRSESGAREASEMVDHLLRAVLGNATASEKADYGSRVAIAALAYANAAVQLAGRSSDSLKRIIDALADADAWSGGGEREAMFTGCVLASDTQGADALISGGVHRSAATVLKRQSATAAAIDASAKLLSLLGTNASSKGANVLDTDMCYASVLLKAEALAQLDERDSRRSALLTVSLAAECLADCASSATVSFGRRAPEVSLLQACVEHSSASAAHAAASSWLLMKEAQHRRRLVAGGFVDGIVPALARSMHTFASTTGEGRTGRRDVDRNSLSRAIELLLAAVWMSLYPPSAMPAADAAPRDARKWDRVRAVILGSTAGMRRREAGGAALSQDLFDLIAQEATSASCGDRACRLALSTLHAYASTSEAHAQCVASLGITQSLKSLARSGTSSAKARALAAELTVMLASLRSTDSSGVSYSQRCELARELLHGTTERESRASAAGAVDTDEEIGNNDESEEHAEQQPNLGRSAGARQSIGNNEEEVDILVSVGARLCAMLAAEVPNELAKDDVIEQLASLASQWELVDAVASLLNLSVHHKLQPAIAKKALNSLLVLNSTTDSYELKMLTSAALSNLAAHPSNATLLYKAELSQRLQQSQLHEADISKLKQSGTDFRNSLLKPQRTLWGEPVSFDTYGIVASTSTGEEHHWHPRVHSYEASDDESPYQDDLSSPPSPDADPQSWKSRGAVPHLTASSRSVRPNVLRHAASAESMDPIRPASPATKSKAQPEHHHHHQQQQTKKRREKGHSGNKTRYHARSPDDVGMSVKWRPDSVRVVLDQVPQAVSFRTERARPTISTSPSASMDSKELQQQASTKVLQTAAAARKDAVAKARTKHHLCMFSAVDGSKVSEDLFPTYVLPSGRKCHFYHKPARVVGPVRPHHGTMPVPDKLEVIAQVSLPRDEAFLLAHAGELDEASEDDGVSAPDTSRDTLAVKDSQQQNDEKEKLQVSSADEKVPCALGVSFSVSSQHRKSDDAVEGAAREFATGQDAADALFGGPEECTGNAHAVFDAAWASVAESVVQGSGSVEFFSESGEQLAKMFCAACDAFRTACSRKESDTSTLSLSQAHAEELLGMRSPSGSSLASSQNLSKQQQQQQQEQYSMTQLQHARESLPADLLTSENHLTIENFALAYVRFAKLKGLAKKAEAAVRPSAFRKLLLAQPATLRCLRSHLILLATLFNYHGCFNPQSAYRAMKYVDFKSAVMLGLPQTSSTWGIDAAYEGAIRRAFCCAIRINGPRLQQLAEARQEAAGPESSSQGDIPGLRFTEFLEAMVSLAWEIILDESTASERLHRMIRRIVRHESKRRDVQPDSRPNASPREELEDIEEAVASLMQADLATSARPVDGQESEASTSASEGTRKLMCVASDIDAAQQVLQIVP